MVEVAKSVDLGVGDKDVDLDDAVFVVVLGDD